MNGFRTHVARLTTIFLFLFSICDSIAQKLVCPYSIHLRVNIEIVTIDSAKSQTIAAQNAEIFIEQDHRKTYTSVDGIALIDRLCNQNQEVEINYKGKHYHFPLMGYSSNSFGYEITLQAYKTANSKLFTLRDTIFRLLQVPIDSLNATYQYSDFESMLDVFVKRQGPHTQGDVLHGNGIMVAPQQNLSKSLEPLPLTQTLSSGMGIGKPVVQGMFGQRLPILNNGFRIEGQTWGLDHAPETDIWGAQSVQLLRGTDALAVGADA